MGKKKRTIELEIQEIPEDMANEPEYFIDELKEIFEHHGWKVVWNSVEGEEGSDSDE